LYHQRRGSTASAENETTRTISLLFLLRMTERNGMQWTKTTWKERALAFRAHEKSEIIEVEFGRQA
jgi:hypothetical protein